MGVHFERDDSGIRVHERGVIAQLCSLFRSHEQGLPEWFKNSSTAYARNDTPTTCRALTLLFGSRADGATYVALLDHAGMSVEDLEQKFANWGDPEAHLSAVETEEVLEGGHGNGGKCYMTQMFSDHSYLHTVKNARGSKYGFVGDDPHPGYFPDKRRGRGFPVDRPTDELRRALSELGVEYQRLPAEVRTAAASTEGFTLVAGICAKALKGQKASKRLIETVILHAQMAVTVEKNRIHVMVQGRPLDGFSPVVPLEIQPHEYAPDPKVLQIPDLLVDPVTGSEVATHSEGDSPGQLVISTSKVSMKWKLKGRHHIRYIASGRPIAFLKMDNVSRSTWVDKMYGECRLESLTRFETPDRTVLADAPLTRALEEWIKTRVLDYEKEFKQRERLTTTQEHRNKLQQLNHLLDKWKNRFLDDTQFGAGSVGDGDGIRRRTRSRPLRQGEATHVSVSSPFLKAGVGVWLRMKIDFRDEEGQRVAPPAYSWFSSDWAVATVDDNRVVTHSPGQVEVWVETADGRLRSDRVAIQVLDAQKSTVIPNEIQIKAGQVQQLEAVVLDREGVDHQGVFLTWVQDDSSVLHVTATGKIVGQKQGKTRVFAIDERCVNSAEPSNVEVLPAEVLPGASAGRSYPRILISEVDPDPLNPDGDPVSLSAEDGPVHQPTPQHVEHNIWWINLQCPLAKLYFETFGPESREWISYHVERYIEALAKIRLSHDFQVSDEELTFDQIERRWREVAAEVQRRALSDLRSLLEEGDFPR